MWKAQLESEQASRIVRMSIEDNGAALTYREVLRLWRETPEFCAVFNGWLAESPFTAFRWETPMVTMRTLENTFECVMLDSPGLSRPADVTAFAKQFREARGTVVEFPNLGGDAIMVVPCPKVAHESYVHLAAFVRGAPETQRNELWKAVGEAMQRRVSERPVWLSTAGGGVAWLHVRLDDRPKYYGYARYRKEPA